MSAKLCLCWMNQRSPITLSANIWSLCNFENMLWNFLSLFEFTLYKYWYILIKFYNLAGISDINQSFSVDPLPNPAPLIAVATPFYSCACAFKMITLAPWVSWKNWLWLAFQCSHLTRNLKQVSLFYVNVFYVSVFDGYIHDIVLKHWNNARYTNEAKAPQNVNSRAGSSLFSLEAHFSAPVGERLRSSALF